MDLEALKAALAEVGVALSEVEDVLITHHHPDHYALAGRLEVLGMRVWLPEAELARGHRFWLELRRWIAAGRADLLRHGAPARLADEMERSMRATRQGIWPPRKPRGFAGRFVIQGRTILALPAPGHAEGQAVLLLEGGVLLAADAIMEKISPMVAKWPYSEADPLGRFLETLGKLAKLPVRVALPGHFAAVDLERRAAELKAHHAERLEATKNALLAGPKTAWAVTSKLFPDLDDPTQQRFALAETLAHLEHLTLRGELRRLPGEVVRYAT